MDKNFMFHLFNKILINFQWYIHIVVNNHQTLLICKKFRKIEIQYISFLNELAILINSFRPK